MFIEWVIGYRASVPRLTMHNDFQLAAGHTVVR